jgi:hypothetical protein
MLMFGASSGIANDTEFCSAHKSLTLPFMEGLLCRMSSDLLRMDRGELCHNRCMGLLADCMQDVGATKPNASGVVVQAPYLSPGFSDFGDCHNKNGGRVGARSKGFYGVGRGNILKNSSRSACATFIYA